MVSWVMSTINTSVDTCSVEVLKNATPSTQPNPQRDLSSPSVSSKSSCTLSTSIPPVFLFNTKKPEAASKHPSRSKDMNSLANVSGAFLSPTISSNDNSEISSLTELLSQMHTWRTEDRTYLDQMKTDLSAELLAVEESNALLIEAFIQEIAAENNVLRTEIAQNQSRLATL
ncbi:hypothetical protein KQX54_011720 [Cotesia glomerata]|uniref:Uncharacterized protein n=1 Tax=Cotesia glomerata TaxID=32391 RepID=A0AAV7I2X9_COTGL|nr:hypothetical protein KQX54_011720 [Cotesia glomerata]